MLQLQLSNLIFNNESYKNINSIYYIYRTEFLSF